MQTKIIENPEAQSVTTVIQYDDGHISITTQKQVGKAICKSDIYLSEQTAKKLYVTLHQFYHGEEIK